jgi:alkanesulfonate monooxygenase SsuD/methylene tetrahydromethanopterin reductase-like flavin-dependent oxidoreductase (luciferase family)
VADPGDGAARPLRLALEVWGADWRQIAATARAAEDLGFAALYYGEAPHGLNLETGAVLAALAERTTTLRLGPVIAHLLPSYRSFPLFVRQLHGLAVISGGRLDVRTGTGAASGWARPWWEPAGVDYPHRAARRRILEEWLAGLHHVWSRPGEPFAAAQLRFDRLVLEPPVERPPITVAAVGPRSMAIAARYADVWEASYLTPAEFGRLRTVFDGLAGDRGPGVQRSLEVDAVTASSDPSRRQLETRFLAERGADGPAALEKALRGTAPEVADQLAAYRTAGVDQLVVAPADLYDRSTLDTLAEAAALLGP